MDTIKTIKQLSELVLYIKRAIEMLRIQDFFHGQASLRFLIQNINRLPENIMADMTPALGEILSAQQNGDNILIADLLEIQLLPYAENMLQQLILDTGDDMFTDYTEANTACLADNKLADMIKNTRANTTGYSVEATNLGGYTVKYLNGSNGFYYHSNTDPVNEGRSLTKYYSRGDCFDYTVLGFGFGYHIRELLKLDRRFSVTAVESNPEILALAFMYCDLTDILSDKRFKLVFCNEDAIGRNLPHTENENSTQQHSLIIHYPSLRAIKNEQLRATIRNYFINTSSMLGQKKYLDWNFFYNLKQNDRPVDDILPDFAGKSVVFAGGGPSLEYKLDYLRRKSRDENTIVLCASTVYIKLLENNIIPDYVVITDAKDNMVNHIKGAPKTDTRLIYLCTASSMAIREFDGTRYIMFQHGYDDAEEYAAKNGYMLIETGGSVSTSAIDLILRSGCRELITLGLDLAYTDNKSHSFENPASVNATKKSAALPNASDSGKYGGASLPADMLMVKSVAGGLVPTTNILNIYRLWLEKRFKSVSGISLTNISRGAYIEGIKNVTD